MNPDQFLKELEGELKTLVNKFKEDLKMIRSNRPSIDLIENIMANYYEQMMPIKQLGSLSIQPPRDVIVTVWDKNAVAPIMKAIEGAKVGLTVSNDNLTIRASLPQLTNERREELMKLVKKTAEQIRIQIRGKRDEANKKIKAAQDAKELNEDQVFKTKEKIQKSVDQTNGEVEKLVEGKLKELSE